MITKLCVQNFQSHDETELDLHPGLNVIVGASDSGKSAIIRALNWAANNRPAGEGFRSSWGGDTRVLIETADDHSVCRSRSNNANQYVLNGTELEAFGQGVPEDVVRALNIQGLNLQFQMDPPFLLSDTGGEIARLLNDCVHLSVIDDMSTHLRSRLRDVGAQIREGEDRIAQYKDEIEALKWRGPWHERVATALARAQDLEDEWGHCEKLADALDTAQNLCLNLSTIPRAEDLKQRALALARSSAEAAAMHGRVRALERAITDALDLRERALALAATEDMSKRVHELLDAVPEIERIRQRTMVASALIAEIQDLNTGLEAGAGAADLHGRVLTLVAAKKEEKIVALRERLRGLDELRERAQALNRGVAEQEGTVTALRKNIEAIRPPQCPLCGSPWPDAKKT